jgi:hypothetical protein
MMARDRGSALVEALAAAAITAAVLGVTLETAGQAAARRSSLDDRRTAVLIARSELAAAGTAIPLAAGETSGVEGDFVWRVHIEPTSGGALSESRAGPAQLVVVAVRRAEGGPDLVVLKTLRLAEAP